MSFSTIAARFPNWIREGAKFASSLNRNYAYNGQALTLIPSPEPEADVLYEVNNGLPYTIKRVYTRWEIKRMEDVLSVADELWPSHASPHSPCENCWHASPCLAVRVTVDGHSPPINWTLCSFQGCGEIVPLLQTLEEKLHFLRRHGIDAFIAWED